MEVKTSKQGIKSVEASVNDEIFYSILANNKKEWNGTINFRNFVLGLVDFDQMNFNDFIEIQITVADDAGKEITEVKKLKNYTISTANDLRILANEVNSGRDFYKGKTISQVRNIDMQGTSSNPNIAIGKNINFAFEGTYDGEIGQSSGHFKIENIYIDSSEPYQGLFAYNKGTIRNIGIEGGSIRIDENAKIPTINGLKGGICVGGIVGLNYSNAVIENCYNTATIISDATVENFAGGIIGTNIGTVKKCYNKGIVSSKKGYTGGIVGQNIKLEDKKGTIEYCYNRATINGNIVGGLVGYLGPDTSINYSYTTANVTGNEMAGIFYGVLSGKAYNCFRINYEGKTAIGYTDGGTASISTGNVMDAIQTETSIKSDNVLNLLGGTSYWKKDTENKNDGYHRLVWE